MSDPSTISTILMGSLPPGTRLLEYEIERVLGHGGFGITYLARDTHLDKRVAIKEYLPTDLAARAPDQTVTVRSPDSQEAFRWGLESFIKEARVIGKFAHASLIQVHRYFEANHTAYFVMEYAEGVTLSAVLRQEGTLPEERLRKILFPILNGLEEVHRLGVLHRDIKPDNIILREGSQPVLIDFGAARQTLSSMTRSVMSVLTAGYAPIEQYATSGNQGPWTDLYAVGAVAYRALSGKKPIDAVNRIRDDPMVPAAMLGKGKYAEHFLAAIDWALAVNPEDRPSSVAELKLALDGQTKPPEITRSGRRIDPAQLVPDALAASNHQTVMVRKPPRPKGDWLRWMSIGGAAVVAAVVIASVLRTQRASQEPAAPAPVAQAPETAAPAGTPPAVPPAAPAPELATSPAPATAAEKPATAPEKPPQTAAPAKPEPAPGAPPPKAAQAEPPRTAAQVPPQTQARTEPPAAPAPAPAVTRPAVQPVSAMAPLTTFQDCAECPTMVALAAGSFTMGAAPQDNANKWEGPAHTVTLASPIAIGRHEVTVREWQACVAARACPVAAPGVVAGDAESAPVVNVDWSEARAYARWLTQKTGRTYRLPTEAEWEYAIRANTTTARYWAGDRTKQCRYGNGADQSAVKLDPKLQAAECDDGFAVMAPVGRFQPNAFGLYDMAGNAWEWTEDCWRDSYRGAPADGRAIEIPSCPNRVIRGGSWRARPNSLRSFGRGFSPPGVRSNDLGLRVVAE